MVQIHQPGLITITKSTVDRIVAVACASIWLWRGLRRIFHCAVLALRTERRELYSFRRLQKLR